MSLIEKERNRQNQSRRGWSDATDKMKRVNVLHADCPAVTSSPNANVVMGEKAGPTRSVDTGEDTNKGDAPEASCGVVEDVFLRGSQSGVGDRQS